MNRTLTTLSNMFTNLDISDMETCYKLFRREVLQSIDLQEDRFGFDPEVTAKLSQLPCRLYECAINYTPRTVQEGKKINWRDGIHALYCILHYGAPTAPVPMQLILYSIIGTLCGIVNVVVFSGLYFSKIPLVWAVAVAFVLAAAVNYALCVLIVFQNKARWNTGGEIVAYLVTILLMGLLDYAVTSQLTGLGLAPTTSKTISVIVGFLGNFLLRRFFVFRKLPAVRI
jgi:putative flippase GtrA